MVSSPESERLATALRALAPCAKPGGVAFLRIYRGLTRMCLSAVGNRIDMHSTATSGVVPTSSDGIATVLCHNVSATELGGVSCVGP